MADSEADEIFGCIFFLLGIILVGGVALLFFSFIVGPVFDGGAPTWKVWLSIIGVALYGLLGGLGKAFEAGFSSTTLLNFFGKHREPEETKNTQPTETDNDTSS